MTWSSVCIRPLTTAFPQCQLGLTIHVVDTNFQVGPYRISDPPRNMAACIAISLTLKSFLRRHEGRDSLSLPRQPTSHAMNIYK